MTIAVFGNYGVKNIGDDLILMGLMEKYHQDELIVYCGNPRQVTEQFDLAAHPFFPAGLRSLLKYLSSSKYRQQVREAYNSLQQADKVIIGGGGILVDKHFKALLLWWRQLRVILRTRVVYEFRANSMELKHWWSKWLFEKYLHRAQKITVRDQQSHNFIQSLGLKSELVQDLSSYVKLESSLSEASAPRGLQEKSVKKICLALCRWGFDELQKKAMQQFIVDKITEGYQVVALAFQSLHDDDRQLLAEISPEITIKSDLDEILNEINSCSLLIGMRFHSLVLAERFQIPSIALAYQSKVSNFMKDKGREDLCLPIQKLDQQKLQELFEKVIANKG